MTIKRLKRVLSILVFHVKQFVRRWFIMFTAFPLIIVVYEQAGYATAAAIYLLFFISNIHRIDMERHLESHLENAILLVSSIQKEIAMMEKHINEQNGQKEQ